MLKRRKQQLAVLLAALIGFMPATTERRAGRPDDDESQGTVLVQLIPPATAGTIPREIETIGLVTALVEEGLTHVRGVVPYVGDRPPSPGLSEALPARERPWTGQIWISGAPPHLVITLELCDAKKKKCSQLAANENWEKPEVGVGWIVEAAAQKMGREVVGRHTIKDVSRDDYATMIAGRSAAVGYAMRAAVEPEQRGNVRFDPVARAPFLDPSMELAWWEMGRQASGLQEAYEGFRRARELAPGCPLHVADEALALESLGQCDAAWQSWQNLDALAPGDVRFATPRIRAALCAERLDEAEALLAGFLKPPTGEIARLQVVLSEKRGELPDHEQRLAAWMEAAPRDPRPVRARIALLVRQGRLAEAMGFTGELAGRGAAQEAKQLQLALAANLDDWPTAAAHAVELRVPEAERILARAAMAEGKHPSPPYQPEVAAMLILRAEQLLAAGHPEAALRELDAALAARPWSPEAIDMRARALEAMNRGQDAAAARALLRRVDPAYVVENAG